MRLQACAPTDPDRVRTILGLAVTALAGRGRSKIDAGVSLPFALVEASLYDGTVTVSESPLPTVVALLGSERDLLLGLVDADWMSATTGAISLAQMILSASKADKTCSGDSCADDLTARKKVLAVLAAASKYAVTIKSTASQEQIQAERKEILKELVTRVVSRSGRTGGLVVSLGGNLGVLGGARLDSSAKQWAFPLQLGLGVGVQSYHSSTVGFHAMLTALDLGQYVTFDSGDLKVSSPDAASAVIIGATVGVWTVARETPFFIGPYFAASPFVKTAATDKTTYQVGLSAGIYVPLFDFN